MEQEKSIYMDEIKKEGIMKKAKNKVKNVINWGIDHKESLLVLAPVVISGTIEIIKIVAKKGNLKAEQHLKEDFVYDSKCRHYYELNRKPKNSDWISIDKRTSNGELLGSVLKEMGFID